MTSNGNNIEREISRGVVSLYKEYMGRGPTFARTYIAGDAITCVTGEAMTKAERQLVEQDRRPMVREIRRQFQEAMGEDLIALVENLTERKVHSLLSDHDPANDVAVEVWVLEPDAD